MHRREFIGRTVAGVTAGSLIKLLPASGREQKDPEQQGLAVSEGKIGYIRQEIPAFEIPPYRGHRYEDLVPDTLDIAERAGLAINSLTRLTDPAVDYEQYFLAIFYRNPPVLWHDNSDVFCQPKWYESLPLMRVITGSDLNSQVDPIWVAAILKSIGPDGFYYIATEGRPWVREGLSVWSPNVLLPEGTLAKSNDAPLSQITNQTLSGRIIGAMTLLYLRDRNPMWKEAIERMVDRWLELAIDRGDYCYYPVALLVPNSKTAGLHIEPPTGLLAAEMGYRLIQGLSQYYRINRYEPARILAQKLSHYVRYHAVFYDPHGRFIDRDPNKVQGHFHGHTFGLLGMLEYSLATGDHEMMEFVKQSFEWARTNTYGCALTGFYPEIVTPGYRYCEGCCMADMIALALKLTQAGVGDYWDDVDRWVRNQFAEGQLTATDWVYQVARALKPKPVEYNETADHPAERSLGAFLGCTTGNDYGDEHYGLAVVGCCNGNGTRTLYYIWQRIVDYHDGRLRVNLLLNRASAWVDVYSYIPYEGRVDLQVKQSCDGVLVRMPEWIPSHSGQVVCSVHGVPRGVRWEGRYVSVGATNAGDTVTITFPISERTVKTRIGEVDYTLVLKGNTVLSVDPPGKFYRLYERGQYRSQVRRKKVARFVSEEQITW